MEVSGGNCGADAAISFTPSAQVLTYLRDGVQGGWWKAMDNVQVEYGTINQIPDEFWTGSGGNRGWIIRGRDHSYTSLTFASSYNPNNGWNYCNAHSSNSGSEIVKMSYHTPDPDPTSVPVPAPSSVPVPAPSSAPVAAPTVTPPTGAICFTGGSLLTLQDGSSVTFNDLEVSEGARDLRGHVA